MNKKLLKDLKWCSVARTCFGGFGSKLKLILWSGSVDTLGLLTVTCLFLSGAKMTKHFELGIKLMDPKENGWFGLVCH